jgi:hypothetical protein
MLVTSTGVARQQRMLALVSHVHTVCSRMLFLQSWYTYGELQKVATKSQEGRVCQL